MADRGIIPQVMGKWPDESGGSLLSDFIVWAQAKMAEVPAEHRNALKVGAGYDGELAVWFDRQETDAEMAVRAERDRQYEIVAAEARARALRFVPEMGHMSPRRGTSQVDLIEVKPVRKGPYLDA